MAASDQTYRSQRNLDIVFGVSCLLMLVSIVGMFAQDYFREFKREQRDFRDVEEALYGRQVLRLVPDAKKRDEIKKAEEEVAAARKERDEKAGESRDQISRLLPLKVQAEAKAQAVKADYDSIVSIWNIEVEKRDESPADSPAYQRFANRANQLLAQVNELQKRLSEKQAEVENLNRQYQEIQSKQKSADDRVAQAEDRLKKLTDEFNRFTKLAAQKRWKPGDTIRALPVLDAFASPERIQQYTLAELPIDYNFKQVTRYDRCTTCHQGIERPAFEKQALRELSKDVTDDERNRLNAARELLEERAKLGDKDSRKAADDAAELRLATLSDRELTEQRISEYCAHPRLDLFVDGNSPHPAEKFGCTICHGGQGSATDFNLASHTPNDALQKEDWTAHEGWEANHFWDFPMLPRRFIESSCLKCHHQVTDLIAQWDRVDIRDGKKVEAPGNKVVRGYNLLRENGCFGCHEIAGIKGGRPVGPDLRLEPSPPLEEMTPAERAKMLADPMNPPGNQRKVGPSLRRISEKTNQQWARRWIQAPRGFRPDTKMPHFYGLSNNRPDVLPEDQKLFPAAEIHSIAYYLFRESKDYLQGKDTSYVLNLDRKKELQRKQTEGTISEAETKELEEVTRRLEIAGIPVPIKDQLTGPDGSPTQLPPAPTDEKGKTEQLVRGRQLFTEKGCLACHSHAGTEQAMANVPAVQGEAIFGPNLSRLAAKIAPEDGDPDGKRRWLVQWIMEPHIHSPRTRMPVTHLVADQAADIAAWLLSQPAEGWNTPDPEAPTTETLERMARLYLEKSMPRQEVSDLITAKGLTPAQDESLRANHREADELRLSSARTDESWDNKLRWYVGKKAISALGCFGCHEIPGFEYAKPIGTPLNDWGKKDPERLAFEDVTAYVKSHYNVRYGYVDDKGHGYAPEDGREAYEQYFWEALEHHTRDGFLYQKLREPRSYDYHRDRTWDDRLRMPQFQFARGVKPLEGETLEQAEAREEAEAREAVMTFVLGLVAEPVPLKYLNDPPAEKLAIAKGKQVLEKFNCAGCHALQAGIYDLHNSPAVAQGLEDRYKEVTDPASNVMYAGDNPFPGHNAWTGRNAPRADVVRAHGWLSGNDPDNLTVRLTEALHFSNPENQPRDIPAAETIALPVAELVSRSDTHGGTFADLLVPYLVGRKTPGLDDPPKARSGLPPPLFREGEKAQPSWLFQFLRNPQPLRPVTILRMPRFNMNDDEAMTLVNYFAAVDRTENPDVALDYPYLAVPQRDPGYLTTQSREYVARLGQDRLKERAQAMQPLWERLLQDRITDLQQQLKAAETNVQKVKDTDKAEATRKRDDLQKQVDRLTQDARNQGGAFQQSLREQLASHVYATDAYRLLANYNLCLKCHQVAHWDPAEKIGPSLNLASDRLRPDWTKRWIASPQRLLVYPDGNHPMPQPFIRGKPEYQEIFNGSAVEQATGLRDVLMTLPEAADMPENRLFRPSTEIPK